MQNAISLVQVWTRVAESISYDDTHYTRVPILTGIIYISYCANTLGKGRTPIILPSTNSRVDCALWPWYGNRSKRRKTQKKSVKFSLKIDLVSHPARTERQVNTSYTRDSWSIYLHTLIQLARSRMRHKVNYLKLVDFKAFLLLNSSEIIFLNHRKGLWKRVPTPLRVIDEQTYEDHK